MSDISTGIPDHCMIFSYASRDSCQVIRCSPLQIYQICWKVRYSSLRVTLCCRISMLLSCVRGAICEFWYDNKVWCISWARNVLSLVCELTCHYDMTTKSREFNIRDTLLMTSMNLWFLMWPDLWVYVDSCGSYLTIVCTGILYRNL